MGFKEAAVPISLFVLAVFMIAQASITIDLYVKSDKPKDAAFKFSIFVLVAAICVLIGSGIFIYRAFKGAAPEVPAPVTAAPVNVAPVPAPVE
jgi:hypothetical protein